MSDPLAPIAPECKASAPTTLYLKEKKMSLSGDSAAVKDSDGNDMYKINAHLATMSARRTLSDSSGKELGQVRKKKTPGLHPTCYVGTMSDEKKCSVKVKGMMNPAKCDADIYVGNDVVGEASGNWRAKTFSIQISGKEVASIKRVTSAASLALGADSYSIEVCRSCCVSLFAMRSTSLSQSVTSLDSSGSRYCLHRPRRDCS